MGSDVILQGPLESSPAAGAWLGVPDPCGLGPGDFSKGGRPGEGGDGSRHSFILRAPEQGWKTERRKTLDSEFGRPWRRGALGWQLLPHSHGKASR